MSPSTLRASELAAFSYCQRAWHYDRIGVPHENYEHLLQGSAWHDQMEHRSRQSRLLFRTGLVFVICGTALTLFSLLFN